MAEKTSPMSYVLFPVVVLAKSILYFVLGQIGLLDLWKQSVIIHDDLCYISIVLKGDLGFGEAFMAGKLSFTSVESADKKEEATPATSPPSKEPLEQQAEAALALFRGAVDPSTSAIYSSWLVPAAHIYVMWAWFLDFFTNLQSVRKSADSISSHYDQCTKTIESMTAPSYVYTCGHWAAGAANITEAQHAKMGLVCEKMNLPRKTGKGSSSSGEEPKKKVRVLDIGCGYGALGKFMTSHFDVEYTGISISREQVDWANRNVCNQDLRVIYCDYRRMPTDDLSSPDSEWMFDGICSVGMFEAVGPANYREFLQIHEKHLKPRGIVVLHTITQCFSTRVNLSPWLIKHIFPDGTLPSPAQVFKAAEKVLVPEDMHQFGPDYAKTLHAWRSDWLAREESSGVKQPTETEERSFRRMWWFYLTMCEALFQVRHANLTQFVFSKGGLRDATEVLAIRDASHRIQDLQSCKTTTVDGGGKEN